MAKYFEGESVKAIQIKVVQNLDIGICQQQTITMDGENCIARSTRKLWGTGLKRQEVAGWESKRYHPPGKKQQSQVRRADGRHFKVDSMQNYLRNVIRKESSAHWLTLKSLMSTNILYPGELLGKMYSLQATAGCTLWQWSIAALCRCVFCSAASTRQSSCLSGTDMPGCSWAQTW